MNTHKNKILLKLRASRRATKLMREYASGVLTLNSIGSEQGPELIEERAWKRKQHRKAYNELYDYLAELEHRSGGAIS